MIRQQPYRLLAIAERWPKLALCPESDAAGVESDREAPLMGCYSLVQQRPDGMARRERCVAAVGVRSVGRGDGQLSSD